MIVVGHCELAKFNIGDYHNVMENIAEFYYEKLGSTDRPGNVLAQFFCSVFDFSVTRKEIILFNKLVKLYGRYVPYFAVLDLYSYEGADPSNPYGLLSYYCKRRLEQKSYSAVVNDAFRKLDNIAERIEEQIQKQRQTNIIVKRME